MRALPRAMVVLSLAALCASSASAQPEPPAAGYPPQQPAQVPRWAHPEPHPGQSVGPQRSGFTLLLALGVGYQNNNPDDGEREVDTLALGGLNLGIGGFVTNDVALLFRVSSTTAFLDEGPFDSVTSFSGVGGFAVQYWPLDALRLEVGAGLGFHNYEYRAGNLTIRRDEGGLGLILAVAGAFWQTEGHALLLGIDYAPAFVEDGPVHNLGFTFGWQLL
jgi:hypothetical protein